MSRPRMFGPAVCRLRSAESGPQPCSGRLITPAAGWRGASMSIHMYQHRRSLARRSRGTMAQLSVRLVVRPVVRLVVARPMVRLEARPVYHRRSPAAPDPYCVPAGPSMVLEETVKDMSSHGPGLHHYAIGDYAWPAPGRSAPRRTAGRSTQPGLRAVGGPRELRVEARHRRSHRLLDPNGPGEPSGVRGRSSTSERTRGRRRD